MPARRPAWTTVLLGSGLAAIAFANSFGPLVARTGAPAIGAVAAEPTCNIVACHAGNLVNQSGTLEILGVPAAYVPGAQYSLTVRLSSTATAASPTRRWGFELTAARLSDGQGAGSFGSANLLVRTGDKTTGNRPYISHDDDTNLPGQASPAEWTFTWTAPAAQTGTVGFYAAGNAANGDLTNLGDFIYTASAQAAEAGTPVKAVTWGRLKSGLLFPKHP